MQESAHAYLITSETPNLARRLTMGVRALYEIPAGLKEGQQRVEEWRNAHAGRRPIPEPLWTLAAELAEACTSDAMELWRDAGAPAIVSGCVI
jgi:hypothetical protein